MKDKDIIRFWSKVNKTDYCWEWTAATDTKGYGKMLTGSRIDNSRKYRQAHRLAYEITKGEIANGLCVMHKCDNPGCVNPAHLSLGTRKDNTQDMINKGRSKLKQHVSKAPHASIPT